MKKSPRATNIYLGRLPTGAGSGDKPKQNFDVVTQHRIDTYNKEKKQGNEVVVYSAVVNNYDTLTIPEFLNPEFDYVCFSDVLINGYGVWGIRPIDYFHINPSKTARYIKTHPHRFFEGKYKWAIWVDSNILIRGDLSKYIHEMKDKGKSFGAITHPHRDCPYIEAETCIQLKKDDAAIIGKQVRKYKAEDYTPKQTLVETGVLVIEIGKNEITEGLRTWWNEIRDFSHRDQLSVLYSFDKLNVEIFRLLREGKSVRNHPDFSHFQHGNRSRYKRPEIKLPQKKPPTFFHEVREKVLLDVPQVKLDIVICVHNALSDFKRLVQSLKPHLNPDRRVVIVNDGSDEETTNYLQSYARNREKQIHIIHNERARGYTRAANQGLKLEGSDVKLLLNSDTILPPQAIDKLLIALYSEESLAVVGPMSNAAGKQSIPSIKNGVDNTAINSLPPNYTIEEVDKFCEKVAIANFYPRIPLVHGFCIMIKTLVLESVGYFDEKAFPKGYGEENDLCFKIANAGYDLAVATNTFIYHAKSKSYSDAKVRSRLMGEGIKKLQSLYKGRVTDAGEQMKHHPELQRIRREAARLWRQKKKPVQAPKKKNMRTRRRR